MELNTTTSLTNYDLISQIAVKNLSLKQMFREKKNIVVDRPEEIQSWLEIVSAINLELAEKVGRIEVLLKWYKIMTSKSGYSENQIRDNEQQIINILKELINSNLEDIDLEPQGDDPQLNFLIDQEEEDSSNLEGGTIDLDFHLNLKMEEEEALKEEETIEADTKNINLDFNFLTNQEPVIQENQGENSFNLDLNFLPEQEEKAVEIEEKEEIKEALTIEENTGINLDFISIEEPETPEIKIEEINYETATREQLVPQEDQENVNLFDEAVPIEAADEETRTFEDGTPITMEELQIVFNRLSKLSMRYLGGSLTKNYFQMTQGSDPWCQKFQMNSKGQITILGILSQEVSPQELITFKQWTGKFIKNCSSIISNFPMMVKKQNMLGRLAS